MGRPGYLPSPPWQHRRAGGWPAGWRVPAGMQVYRRVLPPSVPHETFQRRNQTAKVPIGPQGFARGIIASTTLTLSVGPIGWGTSWDLAQASVATTTGINDSSVCTFYSQPPAGSGTGLQPYQIGVGVLGGAGQVGLAGIKLVPGERLYAVWTLANNGDTATLILTGTMTVLT